MTVVVRSTIATTTGGPMGMMVGGVALCHRDGSAAVALFAVVSYLLLLLLKHRNPCILTALCNRRGFAADPRREHFLL